MVNAVQLGVEVFDLCPGAVKVLHTQIVDVAGFGQQVVQTVVGGVGVGDHLDFDIVQLGFLISFFCPDHIVSSSQAVVLPVAGDIFRSDAAVGVQVAARTAEVDAMGVQRACHQVAHDTGPVGVLHGHVGTKGTKMGVCLEVDHDDRLLALFTDKLDEAHFLVGFAFVALVAVFTADGIVVVITHDGTLGVVGDVLANEAEGFGGNFVDVHGGRCAVGQRLTGGLQTGGCNQGIVTLTTVGGGVLMEGGKEHVITGNAQLFFDAGEHIGVETATTGVDAHDQHGFVLAVGDGYAVNVDAAVIFGGDTGFFVAQTLQADGPISSDIAGTEADPDGFGFAHRNTPFAKCCKKCL